MFPKPTRDQILKEIRKSKDRLLRTPGFQASGSLKGIYVVACTLEGAILHEQVDHLAAHCIEFVQERLDQEILSN